MSNCGDNKTFFHPSAYNYEVPDPIMSSLGRNLYPLGNPVNDVYLYANHWNGSAFVNARYIKDAQYCSKQRGISFNKYELNKFKEFRQELEYAIREPQSDYADFYLGRYKLMRYRAESNELEFHKLISTDDRQEFAGTGIVLSAEETLAFFATFDTVESEFCQIVKDLPKLYPAEKSTSVAPQTLKRKAADTPLAAAPPVIKHRKQEPEYLGPDMFNY